MALQRNDELLHNANDDALQNQLTQTRVLLQRVLTAMETGPGDAVELLPLLDEIRDVLEVPDGVR